MRTAILEAPLPQPVAEARCRVLLEQFSAPIARLVAYEPNRADREDLVQDVWLALWPALPATIQRLPILQREVVTLSLEDVSQAAIADKTGHSLKLEMMASLQSGDQGAIT
jgi:hypothetical protein